MRRELVETGLKGFSGGVRRADAHADARRALGNGDARIRTNESAAIEGNLEGDGAGVELGGVAHAHVNKGAVVAHENAGFFVRGDAADSLRGVGPKVRRGDAESRLGDGLHVGVVRQHGDLRRGGVVASAGRIAAGEQDVVIASAGGVVTVLVSHAQVVPRYGRGGADVFDVTPSAGAGLADGFNGGAAGEIVTDIGAGGVAGEVSPGRGAHILRPAQGGGFDGAVNREGVRARSVDLALFDGGLDRARVGAGDALAEADDLVIKHKPGFFPRERDSHAFELHAGGSVGTEGSASDPGMGRKGALPERAWTGGVRCGRL